MMNRLFLGLLLFAICFYSCESDKLRGKIVKVTDGDTVTLLTADNKQIKIRLDGIDAPENSQDYGEKSRLFLADMIAGKTVEVQVNGTDFYKRTLGVIFINGKNANEELVKNGLAWHYKQYNKDPYLAELERKARAQKLNIWSMPHPVAPWDYRKMKQEESKKKKEANPNEVKISGLCGAKTQSGNFCQRKTANGEKCWQHK